MKKKIKKKKTKDFVFIPKRAVIRTHIIISPFVTDRMKGNGGFHTSRQYIFVNASFG